MRTAFAIPVFPLPQAVPRTVLGNVWSAGGSGRSLARGGIRDISGGGHLEKALPLRGLQVPCVSILIRRGECPISFLVRVKIGVRRKQQIIASEKSTLKKTQTYGCICCLHIPYKETVAISNTASPWVSVSIGSQRRHSLWRSPTAPKKAG